MNQFKKLNIIHKAIYAQIMGDIVIETGVKLEGWQRGEHIQHTLDSLMGQIKVFKRQLANTVYTVPDEKVEDLERYLKMYKKDLKNLKFNIQHDQINKGLFPAIERYIESLKDVIMVLEEGIKAKQDD